MGSVELEEEFWADEVDFLIFREDYLVRVAEVAREDDLWDA